MLSYKKLNNIVGWLIWAVATVVYCSTIEPTASFWDCGEYIACAYKMEVGHPPGAPLFLVIGRVFSLLGGGDPATAAMLINVMSALCSSFTILFLFWTVTRLAQKAVVKKGEAFSKGQQWAVIGAGMVGALAYTFSDSFWFSAVEGEVYAMSSFFTAITFWAILRWEEEEDRDSTAALRWIVFIAYLIGLSIGVHLLNLLVIPAIFFIYYFKKKKFSWKGFIITGVLSVITLGSVMSLIIPKLVKFAADYELLFVNRIGMSFNSGTIVYFLLLFLSIILLIVYSATKKERFYKFGMAAAILFAALVVVSGTGFGPILMRLVTLGGLLYGIHYIRGRHNILNIAMMSFATLLIGYSSFFILVIRSQANPPMDENDPENAITLLSYLNREQYGDNPLLYGNYYNAPMKSQKEFKDGEPVYAKNEKTGRYEITDDRKNSIAVYDDKFCTPFPRMWSTQSNHERAYEFWGDVRNHHKNVSYLNPQTGETETAQVPTFSSNMIYFVSYQVKYMYLRYFFWNFVGRQNDVQGLNRNSLEGNAVTGIKAVDDILTDSDTSLKTHALQNNKGTNYFFAIPFLLGLLGIWYQVRRNKNDAWVVTLLFFFTGFAIVLYLNQYPYQPRERDYAYAASFYAFAIWIGLGVLALYDIFNKRTNLVTAAGLATAVGLVAPGIMAAQGWDDHDRSLRTMSRDFAINYLNSCAPNAILFTNGDNDTFPLWYAQEVEGIRTDVRVVNLSLLQTDWYINQMRRAAYDSPPVPFTIPAEKYVQGTRDVVYIVDKNVGYVNLKQLIDFVCSEDHENKLDAGSGKLIDYLPTRKFSVAVDSVKAVHSKVIALKDTARLAKSINWQLNRSYITKNDLMVLDLVAHNNWSRPIYFAVTTGSDAYVGLEDYFQLEGLAYRFVPIKATEREQAEGGRVNTDAMYDNIMHKFQWGGMDKKGVNLDENCIRMATNMRVQMATLANALISEGKRSKAKEVLDKCIEKMPDENVPYDASLFTVVAGYYQLGENDKANDLAKKLFTIMEGDLKVYNAQKGIHRAQYNREMDQAKLVMRRLVSMAMQFKQDALAKEFMERFSLIVPREEMQQQGQPQGEPEPALQ